MIVLPPTRRYRTRTDELAPFWRANALYRHDPDDGELLMIEWLPLALDVAVVHLLLSAGISCYRVVPACPDWLLASIPGLGPVRLAELRRILPYARDIYAGPACPGARLERERRSGPANVNVS